MSVLFTRRGEAPAPAKKASDYAIGESVFLNESESPVEYLVVHQGNPDTAIYDDSCNATWLLRKDIYISQRWNDTNSNDYGNSEIHTWLNDTFLGLFNTKTQSKIKQVKIPYVNGTSGSEIASGENGLSTKVFLLSGYELGWTSDDHGDFPEDGAVLSYFVDATNSNRIAYLDGNAIQWWMRSPHLENTEVVWVNSSSGSGNNSYPIYAMGVRPAIIIPFGTRFDPDTNIIL